jgi:hypothetical protein
MRGAPDFRDIARPFYRGTVAKGYFAAVAASARTNLATGIGPGIVWSAYVVLDAEIGQEVSAPELVVDGNAIAGHSFEEMNLYNMVEGLCYPFYLAKYDKVNGYFVAGITFNISFEKSIVLRYYEQAGATPWIEAGLYYSPL